MKKRNFYHTDSDTPKKIGTVTKQFLPFSKTVTLSQKCGLCDHNTTSKILTDRYSQKFRNSSILCEHESTEKRMIFIQIINSFAVLKLSEVKWISPLCLDEVKLPKAILRPIFEQKWMKFGCMTTEMKNTSYDVFHFSGILLYL